MIGVHAPLPFRAVSALVDTSPRDVVPQAEILRRLLAMSLGHPAMVTRGPRLPVSVENSGTLIVQLRALVQ